MKYQPYSIKWTRYRELEEAIYKYLEDPETSPEQICDDIRDVLQSWIDEYSSRADKGKKLKDFFR